jgi:hypothetical protein
MGIASHSADDSCGQHWKYNKSPGWPGTGKGAGHTTVAQGFLSAPQAEAFFSPPRCVVGSAFWLGPLIVKP